MNEAHETNQRVAIIIIIEDDEATATPKSPSNRTPSCCRTSRTKLPSYCSEDHYCPEGNDFFSFPCSSRALVEQKKKFMIFLRILLMYLQRKDRVTHGNLKVVLRRFAAFYRAGDPPSRQDESSLLLEMHTRVKTLVTKSQWNDTLLALHAFLAQRRRSSVAYWHSENPALITPDGA